MNATMTSPGVPCDNGHQWGLLRMQQPRMAPYDPLMGMQYGTDDKLMLNTSIFPKETQLQSPSVGMASPASTSSLATNSPTTQHGQPTSKGKALTRPATSKSDSAEAAAASDRSERARNAANRRHSRAKENQASNTSVETRSRQDIEREKNRIAAAKCRKKKRAVTDALDAEYRAATAANTRMKREHRELREQLTYWRLLALQHVQGQQGCHCQAIQRYNNDQASKLTAYDLDAARNGNFNGNFGGNFNSSLTGDQSLLAPAA